jgi:hypothetical protein
MLLVATSALAAEIAGHGRRLQAWPSPLDLNWLQRNLAGVGYLKFDDVGGPFPQRTDSAVRRFQIDHCLPVTGVEPQDSDGRIVNQATDQALRLLVAGVQIGVNARSDPAQRLAVDTLYGPRTIGAVRAQQLAALAFFRPTLPTDGATDDATATLLGLQRTTPACPDVSCPDVSCPDVSCPDVISPWVPPADEEGGGGTGSGSAAEG